MNETERQLYLGMKNAGYTNEDIRALKGVIDSRKVTSASVDSARVTVTVENKFKIIFNNDIEEEEEESYDTHLLKINLANKYDAYKHLQELGEQLLNCDLYDLKVILKNEFSYHDKINFDNVDYEDVRKYIAELI